MVYFDKKNKQLVFIGEAATSKFWDKLWTKKDLKKQFNTQKIDLLVLPTTKKYLKRGSRILEGGCGHGSYVYSLNQAGFDCLGVDFAKKTIKKLNNFFPELPIYYGDVTKLSFKNNSFDGYWSLGVIEHFYDGYGPILSEVKRVVKKGGYVFVTFPYMSPIRRLKTKLNLYPVSQFKNTPTNFYQFALDEKQVIKDFKKLGFRQVELKPFDGFAGLRKEVKFLGFVLNPLTAWSEQNILAAGVRFVISKIVERWTSHAVLLVLQKK